MRARSIPASATAEEEIISDITDDISMADITEESTWGTADITKEEEKALPECEPHQQRSKSQSEEFRPPSITDSSCITDSASITDSLDITDNLDITESLDITDNRQITDTSLITDTT